MSDPTLDLMLLEQIREHRPATPTHLWDWILEFLGIKVQDCPVCAGHSSPFSMFAQQFFDRPPISLWHGPRGSGKSFLSALDTHLTSRFHPGHGTRVLGGSKAQSDQIYQALRRIALESHGDLGNDRDAIRPRDLQVQSAKYKNGSDVSILAASSTSVRGPHVPSLKLDEVDEIESDIREQAVGMAMDVERHGVKHRTSILMTSTWHRSGGPMSELKQRGDAGEFPSHTFCVFEVLERCPASRSGPWVGGDAGYEHCPACPIKPWCHEDRHIHRSRLPKAKRSDGHYTINSLIQKARVVSGGTFASDYLCRGPQTEGLWFPDFSDANVSEWAEYDPALEVHLGVDAGTGRWFGGVWYQIASIQDGPFATQRLHVFADYLSHDVGAYQVAGEILRVAEQRCEGRAGKRTVDPAAKASTGVGVVVLGEFHRAGLHPIEPWPSYPGSVRQCIALVNSFLRTATDRVDLLIHPRCTHLIDALKNYRKKKVRGEYRDEPEDPQHPHEDMVDAFKGSLHAAFPEGRRPEPKLSWVHPSRVF